MPAHNITIEITSANSDATINNIPQYQTDGSAGMDIHASLSEPVIIPKGSHSIVNTGIKVAIPSGYEIQVRSRSGLAFKNGVFVLNSPGTIDSDYRGEIIVILGNLGKEDFIVEDGMRIAQLVISPVTTCQWHAVQELNDTKRGSGKFGSTGI